jgi:20S proteasome subunit beta 4
MYVAHSDGFVNHQANCAPREVLLGITGKDFTLIAASKAAMRGATILKAADDKTRQLNKHTLMAFSGEAGDTGWCLGHSDWRTQPR